MIAETQILVVDDDGAARRATVRALARAGYTVADSPDGEGALQLVRRLRPALVLLDVMLPDISGLEVLRRIKSESALASTSVVLSSSMRTNPDDQSAGIEVGADGYIARPISNAELLARVRAHLRQALLQRSLRASEARFRDLIAQMAHAVLVVDEAGHIAFANREAQALFGKALDALVGAPFGFAVEVGKAVELDVVRADSSMSVVEMRVARTSWNDTPASIVSLFDISERRKAEEALAQRELSYRMISRQLTRERAQLVLAQSVAMVGSWETDLATLEVTWSAETHRIFDTDPASFQPTHEAFLGLVHPEDRARVDDAFRASLDAQQPQQVQHRLLLAGGRVKTVDEHWQIFRDESGVPSRAVGTCQDVTDRLALEEQLRQSHRLEAVGQLTGGVAHDFNNLLTVILGNAELLGEELAGDERLVPLAQMIVEAAQRGAELTQGLLAFARRQPLEPRSIDANALVAGMDGLLRRTLGEHVEIEFRRGAGLRPALVDPAQLESALLNLCINTRDAMPGGGRLTIETTNAHLDEDYADQQIDVQPGHYVMVAVSDTGCGISPENLRRVFEPFYTTKAKGKGTGLGLSMVYGFAKQSCGHVNLYSEPGHGTTVRMYLPQAGAEAPARRARTAPAAATGGHETILLVEDDAMVRRYARDQLATLGYRVIEAGSGPEALVTFEQHPEIDLLFTDVVMPGGMSGRELADAARAKRPGLKVLYTSGYTENAIVHHGRLDPGVQLLSKPYRRLDLARRIRAALD